MELLIAYSITGYNQLYKCSNIHFKQSYLFYNPNVPAQSQTFTEKEVIALIVRIGSPKWMGARTVVEGYLCLCK